MSADSELLIKIKTILESQGIDAAKAKLTELTNTTNAAGLSEAAANKERDVTVDKAEKTAKAVLAMNNAMAGGMGPFRAAIAVANQLGGNFAMLAFKASAVGAAMTIGWKMGSALRDWVTGAKEAEGEMDRIKKASDELRDRVLKLNDIRLNNLKAEAKAIADGFSTAVDKAERLKRLSDLREDTELATDLAGVNLRFEKKEINANERDRLELKYQHESEKRKNTAEEKRINTEEDLSNSRVTQSRGKFGKLSRSAGMAQQDYEQGLLLAKELGIDNAEGVISNGKQDPVLQDLIQTLKLDRKTETTIDPIHGGVISNEILKSKEQLASDRKKASILAELPDLKLLADASKKDLDAYRPIYKKTTESESIKQEQLAADKAALLERANTSSLKYKAGNAVIENKITSDFDKMAEEQKPANLKARDMGQSVIDSLHIIPHADTGNDGRRVSSSKQNELDSHDLSEAKKAIMDATNASFRGGDTKAVIAELAAALRKHTAELSGAVQPKDLIPLFNAIKNINSQNNVSRGADQ